MSTVGEALQVGEAALSASSTSARLDAELLLSHVLSWTRTQLLSRLRDECPSGSLEPFWQLVVRRSNAEPIAYILGQREFYGRTFSVSPSVLIPRPESELLIEEALRSVAGKRSVSFVDLGTGSGCLAVTLVLELCALGVAVRGVAVDISAAALAVARSNAEALGAAHCISFVQGSWLSQREAFEPPYDIIIANPPYVDSAETTSPELAFEPRAALYSGDGGLHDTREILQTAPQLLAAGGVLLIEVGAGKRQQLRQCPEIMALGGRIKLLGDDSAQDRFTVLRIAA